MSDGKVYAIRLMRSKMAFYDDTVEALAADLGITRPTCSKKIHSVDGWTNNEIAKIAARYGLTDDEIIKMFDLNRYCNYEIETLGMINCGGKQNKPKELICVIADDDEHSLMERTDYEVKSLEKLGAHIVKVDHHENQVFITYEI